jgi:hypothetical protein
MCKVDAELSGLRRALDPGPVPRFLITPISNLASCTGADAGLKAHFARCAAPVRATGQWCIAALVMGGFVACRSSAEGRGRSSPGGIAMPDTSLIPPLARLAFAGSSQVACKFSLASFPSRKLLRQVSRPLVATANGNRLGQQHCPKLTCQILAAETSVRLSLNSLSSFFRCRRSAAVAGARSRNPMGCRSGARTTCRKNCPMGWPDAGPGGEVSLRRSAHF